MNIEKFYATGKRKTSIARVFLKNGKGKIKINKKEIMKYITNNKFILIIIQPLEMFNIKEKIDLYITVKGGGISSQAQAIRHGISRALIKYNKLFNKRLREKGYITRDSRKVERKKVGFKKARKHPQYSKR